MATLINATTSWARRVAGDGAWADTAGATVTSSAIEATIRGTKAPLEVELLLRDDGEDTRAVYCAQLEALVGGSRLETAASTADQADYDAIIQVAPASVHPAWTGLSKTFLNEHPSASQQQIDQAKLGAELGKVVQDAQDNCDLTIQP